MVWLSYHYLSTISQNTWMAGYILRTVLHIYKTRQDMASKVKVGKSITLINSQQHYHYKTKLVVKEMVVENGLMLRSNWSRISFDGKTETASIYELVV